MTIYEDFWDVGGGGEGGEKKCARKLNLQFLEGGSPTGVFFLGKIPFQDRKTLRP